MSPERDCTIYGLIDSRTQQIRYVGKTQQALKDRLRRHRSTSYGVDRKTQNHRCANWLRSLYRDGLGFECVVLEVVAAGGDWEEAEKFWIAYFRFVGADLTNHTNGGEGLCGVRRPGMVRSTPIREEERARMRAAWTMERRLGYQNDAWRSKMKATWTQERKIKWSAHRTGKTWDESVRQKIRAAWTPEKRARHSETIRLARARMAIASS